MVAAILAVEAVGLWKKLPFPSSRRRVLKYWSESGRPESRSWRHIWIWSVIEPEMLKKKVAQTLADERNLWLSPVSIWELLVLVRKGRIELTEDLQSWVSRATSRTSFREAPITNEVVMEISKMKFSHDDPADHFIAASARVFDLTLVTADSRLLKLKNQGLTVLAN